MALVTIVAVVVMPCSLVVELTRVAVVDTVIGPPHSVKVAMTSPPGTGRVARIMTRGAVFNIVPGEATVISYPGSCRMSQRHAVVGIVAVNTEPVSLMAATTVSLLRGRLQPVRKLIVQIVNIACQIVSPMALQTVRLTNMTPGTPLAVKRGPITMLMSPVGGVNVG